MAVEPVLAQHILIAAMAGAMVILFGACYALAYAWSRTRGQPRVMGWAWLAYGLLAVSAGVLSVALNLDGFWRWVVGAMLLGYLVAPPAIWHLCVGTHAGAGGHSTKEDSLRGQAGGR